jgi:hypothetical protein
VVVFLYNLSGTLWLLYTRIFSDTALPVTRADIRVDFVFGFIKISDLKYVDSMFSCA